MIIASDMLIAIPIALASISLLFAGIYNSQSYLQSYARSEYSWIRYYSISQQMVTASYGAAGGYANKTVAVESIAKYYNVSVSLTSVSDSSQCTNGFCRVVEIDGIAKLLVVQ